MAIKLLEHDLAEKIAAGEVIERPLSIVKELIENALDAGASRISVEIEDGGKGLIRVADNGCGISADDLPLAVERYATSKIGDLSDLYAVRTLGFRGEALASIKAVSRLRIASRMDGSEAGFELEAEGDAPVVVRPAGCPTGTTVEVRDLFFNMPVRLKFMKSRVSEQRKVQEIIERYALAFHQTGFTLQADGRELLNAAPAASSADRMVDVYGRQAVDGFVAVEAKNDFAAITALVSRPSLSRSARADETIIINNRVVLSLHLRYALERAYRELLPTGRYPLALVKISVDPASVDVNIHPQKSEVRLASEREVAELLERSVRHALLERKLASSTAGSVVSPFPTSGFSRRPSSMPSSGWSPYAAGEHRGEARSMTMPEMEQTYASFLTGEAPQLQDIPSDVNDSTGGIIVLGQALSMYVVAYDAESIIFIDQHAAHERIIYDRLMNAEEGTAQVQVLLIPEVLELLSSEVALLEERLDAFRAAGFSLEPFGRNAYRLTEAPVELAGAAAAAVVRDLLSDLAALGHGAAMEQIRVSICSRIACHAAVKAGDVLSEREMSRLVNDLLAVPDKALTCPHGRPVILRMGQSELLKAFCRS